MCNTVAMTMHQNYDTYVQLYNFYYFVLIDGRIEDI